MDDKGLVDLAELRNNIKKANYEGKSSFGFKIGNKFVKVYAREEDRKYSIFSPPDPSKITDFSGLSADTIIFPEKYILENGLKAGEIARFVAGKRLDLAIKNNIVLDKMITNYEKVINDIYLYDFIDMVDLSFVNILYSDRNGFYIIDTTDWYFKNDVLKINIHRFNSSIVKEMMKYFDIPYDDSNFKYIINNEFHDYLKMYGNYGQRLINVFLLIAENKYSFMKFIESYMDVYRIHYGKEAKTLKDVKELTKVLKKG